MNKKLQNLVDTFNKCNNPQEYFLAISDSSIEILDVGMYCNFSENSYARTQIYKTEHYELLVLCWKKGQFTLVHNHAGSACCMRVLQGELEESQYIFENDADGAIANTTLTSKKALKYAEAAFIHGESQFHQMKNSSDGDAITLHVYSPPIIGEIYIPNHVISSREARNAN